MIVFVIAHNTYGIYDVFSDSEKVKEALKRMNIENQDEESNPWDNSVIVSVYDTNRQINHTYVRYYYPKQFMEY